MNSRHLLYQWKQPGNPGNARLNFFDAQTRFNQIPDSEDYRLIPNKDWDPTATADPHRRYRYDMDNGIYIEADDINWGGDCVPLVNMPQYGIRKPNMSIEFIQYIDGKPVTPGSIQRNQKTSLDISAGTPVNRYLDPDDNTVKDGFGMPNNSGLQVLKLITSLTPGLYGLKYTELEEAEGSIGTTNRPDGKRLVMGSETEYKEPVSGIFFYNFDTTDSDNFKVTTSESYYGHEAGPLIISGNALNGQYDIYLVPRQWFYYVYFLAWYILYTMFWYSYHVIPFSTYWYDRPPFHPVPFTGEPYWASIFAGMDDYGCWWKVSHSQQFADLLKEPEKINAGWFGGGLVWIGNQDYYYRVRVFRADPKQLCAIIHNRITNQKFWIWRKTYEDREPITIVDCPFMWGAR